MAQRDARMIVEGNVARHERKTGQFSPDDRPGEVVTWDYIEARVITPAFDMIEVRFPSDGSLTLPDPDELVRIHCEVRASARGLRITATGVESSLVKV